VAAFIAAQGEQHGIPYATACRALQVSPAWFYKWRHGDPSPRHARRIGLAAEVARLFAKHHGKYGSPRITADLRAAGRRVSENTVATLMREQQLVARAPRRRKQTTRQGRGRWRAPDLIGRDFAAEQVNRKWYGDGTEIATGEGRLFLDSVLDMGSRRIVGFALGEHHDTALAYAALAMAVAVRGGKEAIAGVVFHTG
jgi:putative transposase